ncbi:MAG: transglutaminase family protein [Chitinophagaceae bacterium]|nr:transglutaminase family protein [Chitinophagaceae bacterium]
MATYRIKHITRYTYNAAVIDSANQIMLYPIEDEFQEVKNHTLVISCNPPIDVYEDFFGNRAGLFTIVIPHHELNIFSEIEVTTHPITPPPDNISAEDQWNHVNTMRDEYAYLDFFIKESFHKSNEVLTEVNDRLNFSLTPFQVAMNMSSFVYSQFEYKQGITSVETKIDEVWNLKAGVCQDFAHILLVMLRMAGIPARYVSGYICPRNKDLRGEGATHAWVDAYIPHHGWIGLDPTNNCIVSDRHVRLAVGRNFSDCTPVKGTYKGPSEHTLEVSVSIENGAIKTADINESAPFFTYQVRNQNSETNSYRRYLEMQQQQQQQ